MLLIISMLSTAFHGLRCYTDTLHVFRRIHTMPKSERGDRKYDVYGFCMALQLWAYEAIPALGSKWAIRRETSYLRMLHWRAHEKPSAKDLTAILDDPQLEVHAELVVSMEEEDQIYVRELHVRSIENDPVFESVPDRNRVRLFKIIIYSDL
ncbi:uncharacterized protein LOC111386146 [Olea europaea var. sylvestris]|uniref:uncharacterized protein LOC111386146 n=1 Tax=Olea europaea var. sylvestris TaxID=158386 RepID=UPI000C1CF23A|nr:uncharacterized protein LOC111386146 [Olea europaea var. sylvestris]